MKNIALVAVVVLVAGYFFMTANKPVTPVVKDTPSPTTVEVAADKTFDVKGLNYAFDVKEMKVKKGDKVKINFTNTEGFHDFKIDEFSVATKQIKAGEMESVTFTADKTGTFEYYCSVGQHRANGMWGKLIVE